MIMNDDLQTRENMLFEQLERIANATHETLDAEIARSKEVLAKVRKAPAAR